MSSNAREKIRGLYAIVDTTFSEGKSHVELAGELLIGGCNLLQLRVKKEPRALWDDEVFDIARQIAGLKERYDFTFIINDYVDVAVEAASDGVHVGSNDLSIADVRRRVGRDIMIGYSSHSVDEAIQAESDGADYVAFGAIYPTKTKGPGSPVQGVARLREVVRRLGIPVVAIGGISRANIPDVWSTGVASIAMISGLTEAENIPREVAWYITRLTVR